MWIRWCICCNTSSQQLAHWTVMLILQNTSTWQGLFVSFDNPNFLWMHSTVWQPDLIWADGLATYRETQRLPVLPLLLFVIFSPTLFGSTDVAQLALSSTLKVRRTGSDVFSGSLAHTPTNYGRSTTCLTASFQNLAKPLPECQTILYFAAAWVAVVN